ncbi:MAG: formylglycine-generating enzyme family protein [Verrucomicrobia bacterium]|nr:formylglycine-generating enzyme family protein [Verrucomicrobiota bacterium]
MSHLTFIAAGLLVSLAASTATAESSAAPRFGENFALAQPTLPLVWIAPGTFWMSGTHGAGDDTEVTLTRGYWLGQTEVTQAQWQGVIEDNPLPFFTRGSDRPVETVAWDMAMIFCTKLTERERSAGRLPPGYAYTLPTEAQWEYACRAGTTGPFAGEIDALAWHEGNSGGQTHPVGQKRPNAWGLYDMHGNVQEWCADWFGAYPGGQVNDPTGPALGQYRVLRGGGWAGSTGSCRSAFRLFVQPASGNRVLGFRLALAPLRQLPAAPKSGGK